MAHKSQRALLKNWFLMKDKLIKIQSKKKIELVISAAGIILKCQQCNLKIIILVIYFPFFIHLTVIVYSKSFCDMPALNFFIL